MKDRLFIECPFCEDGVARKIGLDKYQCTFCGIVFIKFDEYEIKILSNKPENFTSNGQ